MTGHAHIVETTYEPHRNLITGVTNRAKSRTGSLPEARSGASAAPPAAPTLQDPTYNASQQIRRFLKMPEGTTRKGKQWKLSRDDARPAQKKK